MGGMSDDSKVDAWMPLWIGAYLADTTHLSRDQHGGYLLLLMAYWRNRGPLLDQGDRLANIVKATPAEWRRLRPVLAEFFEVDGERWVHGRAEKELRNAGQRQAAAKSKASGAAQARWEKHRKQCSEHAPSIAQALPEQCPTPTPSPSPPSSERAGADAPAARARAPDPPEPSPTSVGAVCLALKAAGIGGVSPHSQRLRTLVSAGAEPAEFVQFAARALEVAPGNAFAYVVGAVEGERQRAAASVVTLHRGPMPNRQQALEQRNKAVGERWLADQGVASD